MIYLQQATAPYCFLPCFGSLEGLENGARVVVLEIAFWLPRPTGLRYILPLDMVPSFPPDEHDVVNGLDGVTRPRAERIPSNFFGAVRAWTSPDRFSSPPTFLALHTILVASSFHAPQIYSTAGRQNDIDL